MSTVALLMTVALWAVGFVLRRRLSRCAPSASSEGEAAISVIVPARNEERNLPKLLRSLAAQSVKPCEIIVVDDGSTDRTGDIGREFGATVVRSEPFPEGWRGKTWACHQGARASKGDLLLFLDADTWFESDGLEMILSAWRAKFGIRSLRRGPSQAVPKASGQPEPGQWLGGAFSVGPFHAVQKLHEELSLFFNFNMTVGTVPDGLFGQMLLVDRESYRRVGGHEAVKGRTLENFFLAQRFRAAGIPTQSATGRGVFSFRMYPNGVGELIEGWTKGFASGASQTPRSVLLLVIAWMIGLMLAPIGGLVTGHWLSWGTVYLLCAGQVGWLSRQIGSFHWFTALLYPVPLIFFFAVFARSMLRSGKRVTWKGREIRAD